MGEFAHEVEGPHLPECDWLWEHDSEFIGRGVNGDYCNVCDALRRCEQRMAATYLTQDRHEWESALQAARDAVAALPVPATTRGLIRAATEYRVDALAAIDALREEKL